MNILDQIVAKKKVEVKERKTTVPVAVLENKPFFHKECYSLKRFLPDEKRTGIIAEFKRKSPSKGIINGTADVIKVTKAYASNGASAISVLTDEEFFGGQLKDLEAARINTIPLLRKDFIIDEYQILEAKAYGASVILLIAACLTPQQVKMLAAFAKNLGLEVLLEIHGEDELEHICEGVDLIGVNNRNLKTFEVSIETSLKLIEMIPSSLMAIAESGISGIETIVTLRRAGFCGFLIGEQFMKNTDPSIAFIDFVKRIKAVHES